MTFSPSWGNMRRIDGNRTKAEPAAHQLSGAEVNQPPSTLFFELVVAMSQGKCNYLLDKHILCFCAAV